MNKKNFISILLILTSITMYSEEISAKPKIFKMFKKAEKWVNKNTSKVEKWMDKHDETVKILTVLIPLK